MKKFLFVAGLVTLHLSTFAQPEELLEISFGRKVSSFSHTDDGKYIPKTYVEDDYSMIMLSLAARPLPRNWDGIPWDDFSNVCKAAKISDLINQVSFYNEKNDFQTVATDALKQVSLTVRSMPDDCKIKKVMINITQQDILPAGAAQGRANLYLYSVIYDLTGKFNRIISFNESNTTTSPFPLTLIKSDNFLRSKIYDQHMKQLFLNVK